MCGKVVQLEHVSVKFVGQFHRFMTDGKNAGGKPFLFLAESESEIGKTSFGVLAEKRI